MMIQPSTSLLLLAMAALPGIDQAVPLASLDLGAMSTGWGKVGAGQTVDGNPLRLDGRPCAHGVGTHANSSMNIELKGAVRFTARVGVDDEVGKGKGSVVFTVVVDGVERFTSGIMRGGDAAKVINLDLKGARQMTLIAADAGDGTNADHADWGEAAFIVAGEAPVAATAKPMTVAGPVLSDHPTQQELAARAVAIVEAWQKDHPHRATRQVRVLYWTPADREPYAGHRERLTRLMECTRDFYANQMESWGLGRRTVNLERDADGLVKIHLVKGSIPVPWDQKDEVDAGVVYKDCEAAAAKEGIRLGDETYMIITALTTWDAGKRTLRHYSPYHGGGNSWSGGCKLVDSIWLDPKHLANAGDHFQDGQYKRVSLGKYNSIFVGGTIHELGHGLGLPHATEVAADRPVRGHALMGHGKAIGEELRGESRGMFLTFPHAMRLLAHPQFCGSVKQARDRIAVAWKGLSVRTDASGALVATGTVQGRIPVYAVVGYADPEGGGDYNATVGATVPRDDGGFTLTIPAPAGGKAKGGELRLVACCANGAAVANNGSAGRVAFPFGIDQGTVDMRVTNDVMAIEEARTGIMGAEDRARLAPRLQEVVRRLQAADGTAGKPVPSAVTATVKTMPLSDCAPQVGGAKKERIRFDRFGDGQPLIKAGTMYVHGFEVRSPSRQVWHLGRRWTTIKGSCGRTEDGSRSHALRFIVRGDGKELWHSGKIEEAIAAFTVDVAQVDNLELAVESLVDGKDADATWFEPVLERP